jgi:AcrR family transcriptional regulator
MPSKRDHIVQEALKLFSQNGYDAVSTKSIAKKASVSEGLIFRHFENKEGLLNSVIATGVCWIQEQYQQVMTIDSPQKRIIAALHLPLNFSEKDIDFWKLIFQLKWQKNITFDEIEQPIYRFLFDTYSELEYDNPQLEAELTQVFLDGLCTTIFLKEKRDAKAALIAFIKKMGLYVSN